GQGIGAALPVIYVPGEHLETLGYFPGTHVEITNTFVSAVLISLVVMLWILPVAANLKEVPGRMQAFIEMIVEAWDNLAQSAAGKKGRQIVPLALSIFFFLLCGNLVKVIPGVDTVGELHCAGLTR